MIKHCSIAVINKNKHTPFEIKSGKCNIQCTCANKKLITADPHYMNYVSLLVKYPVP